MLDPARCKRLIVYGGSFDPPHRAHAMLPLKVADAIGADGVLYVPAGQPPHKPGRVLASAADRVAMLDLALRGCDPDRIAVSRIELDRDGPSYTVDTLQRLRNDLSDRVELRLLIGADMMAIFHQWRSPRRIIELAEPVVMARRPLDRAAMLAMLPTDLAEAERAAWGARIVDVGTIDAASTDLRTLLAAGRYDDPAVRASLDDAVIDYIRRRGLYRESQ